MEINDYNIKINVKALDRTIRLLNLPDLTSTATVFRERANHQDSPFPDIIF